MGYCQGHQIHASGHPGNTPCTLCQCRTWRDSPTAGFRFKEPSPEVPPPHTFPPEAKGHLLTDAVVTHDAFLPVALVTVKLVLGGLGYQADAEADRVVGWGWK